MIQFLFFEKGKRKFNNLGVPDVLEVPGIHSGYPTEKPVPLAEVLIGQSSERGELVIDPFMGSGTTGGAALGLGRRFRGNDISREAVLVAKSRLSTVSR